MGPVQARPMRRHVAIAALAAMLAQLSAGPAAAESTESAATPISPSEFEAHAEGYTLYFEREGKPFGAEAFHPDGAVTWRFQDGSCIEGIWRAHGAQMCFLYEGAPEVQCWRMLRDEGGIYAKLLGEGPDAGLELRITGRDQTPLLCGDPGTDL